MFGPKNPRSLPQPGHNYDVAIVGAGLAGTELAWRLARAGRDVLLVSQALDTLGNLFQPTLEEANFPPGSVFSLIREQIAPDLDGWTFHRQLKAEIEATSGIHLLQSTVTALDEIVLDEEAGQVVLSTWEGPKLYAKAVVLAVGSFLKGRLLIGDTLDEAGRLSEVAYDFLADDLARAGVFMAVAEQTAAAVAGAPAYEVRFLTPATGELAGFKLARFDSVYAVGRCTPGKHTYQTVLQDAAQLADLLIGLLADLPNQENAP